MQPKYTYLPFAPKGERLVEGYVATYHAPSTVLGPIPAVSFGFGSGGGSALPTRIVDCVR